MNWKELYDRASFRSLRDLCVVGARKKLNPSDLPPLPREESSAELSRIAFDGWDRTGSLSSALWTVTKRPILYAAPLEFLNICFQLALPLVLRSLLVWISDPSTSTWLIGAGYVTLLFLLRLLSTSILTPQCYALCTRAGIRAERAAMLLVSRKLLRLRGGTRGTGEIVSALAMDATRFGPDLVCHTHLIWSAPLLIALAAVLMFHFLGLAAVGALVVMVLASASMGIVVRKERVLYDIVYKRSDSRMRALTGLLDILRQAKMAAWEDVLARDVRGQRRRQMEAIRKACAVEVVAYTLWDVAPPLTAIAAFGAAGIIPGSPPLTADVIFPVLALIETIKVPLSLMPIISAYGMQAMVCLSRLQRFLEEAECQGRLQMSALPTTETAGQMLGGVLGWHNPKRSEDGGNGNTDTEEEPLALGIRQNGYGAIVVDQTNERASHKVDAPEFSPVLHNVIVSFEKGALIIVRGPVAAGKSSMLSALLGEMTYVSEDDTTNQPPWLNGNFVSYTTQTPWIQNATLRNNILFRSAAESITYPPVDEKRYRETLSACGLLPDIEAMPAGDETEIGERGTTLSGGQRARVALARAVYADADVYLLDDPISALDAHVGEQVFSRVCERGGMLDGKTRILVTHRDDLCLRADWIVHMDKGKVVQVAKGGTGNSILSLESNTNTEQTGQKEVDVKGQKLSSNGLLVEEEHRASGSVSVKLYAWYLSLTGLSFPISALAGMMAMESILLFSDFWLSIFASATGNFVAEHGKNSSLPYADSIYYVRIYLLLTVVSSVIKFATEIVMSFGFVSCATAAHDLLVESLLTAPVGWLDRTPVGRILGRFSGDTLTLDTGLREQLTAFSELGISVLFTYIVISMVTPSVLLVAPVICVVYLRMLRYYSSTKRDVARINSTRHSIVLSKFTEVSSGLHVIRAFGKQKPVLRNIFDIIDKYTEATIPDELAKQMLSMQVSAVSSFVVLSAATAAVSARNVIGPALAGLVLTWSIVVANPVPYLSLVWAQLDSDMIIVERIKEYIYEIPSEKEKLYREGDQALRNSGWPQHGHIELKNASMRYRLESPIVLSNLSVTFPAGKRIGVVGRTGAGKSSILNVILRMTEVCGGSVFIDGVNIADVGLSLLRSSISTVPQDPGLFHGTLESNLDPRNVFSKSAVYKALKAVGMDRSHSLDFEVAHAGANLSAGERQLVCVARALLSKSRIVVLDEASSYVDYERDRCLQEALRQGLAESTVIVIAHRIHTVVECDLVVVMDNGEVVEGPKPPVEMLRNEDSRLFALANELGHEAYEELCAAAVFEAHI